MAYVHNLEINLETYFKLIVHIGGGNFDANLGG
jgi:hypothetical protein